MCFQGFVYFQCGHNRIVGQDCEIAQLGSNPFYIRHQCPNYHASSQKPDFQCGVGKYYCSQSPDGPFLDHVHQKAQAAQTGMNHFDGQLAAMYNEREGLIAQADARGVSQQARWQIPEYRNLGAQYQHTYAQRAAFQHTFIEATAIIQQAQLYLNSQRHYDNSAMLERMSVPVVAGQDPLGKTTAGFVRPNGTLAAYEFTSGSGHMNKKHALSKQQWSQLPPSPTSTPSYDTLRAQDYLATGRRPLMGPTGLLTHGTTQSQEGKTSPHHEYQPAASPERGAGRPRKSASCQARNPKSRSYPCAGQDNGGNGADGEVVRRSARVRNKKVNYAESGESSEASRDPSPAKTDISTFSPLKSDASSPDKHDAADLQIAKKQRLGLQPSRTSLASLNERIADWSKGGTVPEMSIPNPRCATPRMTDLLNSSPTLSTSASPDVSSRSNQFPKHVVGTHSQPAEQVKVSAVSSTRLPVLRDDLSTAASTHPMQDLITPPGTLLNQLPPPATPPAQQWTTALKLWHSAGASEHGSGVAMLPSITQPLRDLEPITTPRAYSTIDATPRLGDARADSGNAHNIESNDVGTHYKRLRRSFEMKTPLSHTRSVHYDDISRDPQKRSTPYSTETEQSSKRLRLSLPGEEDAQATSPAPNWIIGSGINIQTDECETPGMPITFHVIPSRPQETNPSTSETAFQPPVATMSAGVPHSSIGTLDGGSDDAITGQQKLGGPVEEAAAAEHVPDYSDIDWGQADDEFLDYQLD
ncbi:hypothetical protein LTR62_004243 [Meristemomyces frigidus]|uniref:Uncharacterized protein n=1 Tax=Meristemomyces frigidus TaxID=1508187 RepID=A0AAN7YPB5_9PEZI|nr:hypothetical protein LTR62_004243 [Meristemomyces frigidus]